jgi:hypothetical protein
MKKYIFLSSITFLSACGPNVQLFCDYHHIDSNFSPREIRAVQGQLTRHGYYQGSQNYQNSQMILNLTSKDTYQDGVWTCVIEVEAYSKRTEGTFFSTTISKRIKSGSCEEFRLEQIEVFGRRLPGCINSPDAVFQKPSTEDAVFQQPSELARNLHLFQVGGLWKGRVKSVEFVSGKF